MPRDPEGGVPSQEHNGDELIKIGDADVKKEEPVASVGLLRHEGWNWGKFEGGFPCRYLELPDGTLGENDAGNEGKLAGKPGKDEQRSLREAEHDRFKTSLLKDEQERGESLKDHPDHLQSSPSPHHDVEVPAPARDDAVGGVTERPGAPRKVSAVLRATFAALQWLTAAAIFIPATASAVQPPAAAERRGEHERLARERLTHIVLDEMFKIPATSLRPVRWQEIYDRLLPGAREPFRMFGIASPQQLRAFIETPEYRIILAEVNMHSYRSLRRFAPRTVRLGKNIILEVGMSADPLHEATTDRISALALQDLLLRRFTENGVTSPEREAEEFLGNGEMVKFVVAHCPRAANILQRAAVLLPHATMEAYRHYADSWFGLDVLRSCARLMYRNTVELRLRNARFFPAGLLTPEQEFELLDAVPPGRIEDPKGIKLSLSRATFPRPMWVRELEVIAQVYADWIPWEEWRDLPASLQPGDAESASMQMRASIARNLLTKNIPITEASVVAEFRNILCARREIADVALFRGRNVVFAGALENWGEENAKLAGGAARFAPRRLLDAIRRQQGNGRGFDLVHPDASRKSLEQAKRRLLTLIETTPPPATFVFCMHGDGNSIFLFAGQRTTGTNDSSLPITALSTTELSQAFARRLKRFPALTGAALRDRDICVFKNCFSTDLIQGIFSGMDATARFITMGSAESGQLSRSDDPPFNGHFFSRGLQLADPEHISTFGTFFRHEFQGEDQNPTLWVPDAQRRPMQISALDGHFQSDPFNDAQHIRIVNSDEGRA